ncbi:hypothetical protein PI124_g21138 [Phytophthora idaei]|nr:hypothetical protein PI125_g25039 [Phytophthora idaei]KAG3129668.1 hypothetical protein PI126_g20857 [Phytophthora idaei]KAG3233793.1 hypothetical protein PI124_g21138 [Phytophthora idaei]
MRVSIILLAVTAAVLASASGASTFHLSKTASTDQTVATQSAFKPQRRLRKHDSKLDLESDDEERVPTNMLSVKAPSFKKAFNKVDDMDLIAAAMVKGKTVREADEVHNKLLDGILPLLEGMARQGITPQSLTNHATFKELSKTEGKYLQQYYKTYWDTFHG